MASPTAPLVAPTASQTVVEAHDSPYNAPGLTFAVCSLQLVPPSVVPRITASVPPACKPTASQTDADGQAAAVSVPIGTWYCWVQVAPPSTLPSITAAVPSEPTASQVEVAGQTMSLKPRPTGSVSDAHVAPPSVVSTAAAPSLAACPTARHVVVEEQATPFRVPTPAGSVWRVHVVPPSVPPSVVPSTTPPPEVSNPTASQTPLAGQVTGVSPDRPVGTLWTCQLLPPLVVPTIWAKSPTASQSAVEVHERPVYSVLLVVGSVCSLQVIPPLLLATMVEPVMLEPPA